VSALLTPLCGSRSGSPRQHNAELERLLRQRFGCRRRKEGAGKEESGFGEAALQETLKDGPYASLSNARPELYRTRNPSRTPDKYAAITVPWYSEMVLSPAK
jgi:hypothetical protein